MHGKRRLCLLTPCTHGNVGEKVLNCSSQKGAGVRGWAVMQEAKNARKGKRAEREKEKCVEEGVFQPIL